MNERPQLDTGTALSYPYIHPRDVNRLKAALIFWDRVRRIVPPSARDGNHAVGDDDDASLLADESLLVPTEPQPYEEAAAKRFFAHLEESAGALQISADAAKQLRDRNGGIHIEKIGEAALWELQQLGLTHRLGQWVSMREEVGAFYMFCLASEISNSLRSPLWSDSDDDAELGKALLFEPDASQDITEVLLRAGIRMPLPADLTQISTATIAGFARRRASERQRFRNAVDGILQTARSAVDPNAIDDYLASRRVEIEEAVSDHRSALDELRVGAAHGLATITVPASASAALMALPFSPIAAGILAATGLAISGIACYAETRGKLREAKRAAPYHYLMSLDQELGVKAVSRNGGTTVTENDAGLNDR